MVELVKMTSKLPSAASALDVKSSLGGANARIMQSEQLFTQQDINFVLMQLESVKFQLAAAKSQLAKLSAEQNISVQADVSLKEKLQLLKNALRVGQFDNIRAIVRSSDCVAGVNFISVPWEKITHTTIVHVSVSEADKKDQNAEPKEYVGICGDARINLMGWSCQNGVISIVVEVAYHKALDLMVNITILGQPEQLVFAYGARCDARLSGFGLVAPESVQNLRID